jgi:hypothetical protein|tara:strand:- start:267 stop:602 length:336 start_codon:yes stop_codon:yes gene_type:complete
MDLNGNKIIYVDIDETICHYGDLLRYGPTDYSKAIPYLDRIKKINDLYDKDNTIVYWTARGTKTGINWFQLTLEQLNKWECKFHELRMGKPSYDLFIDDKNINSDTFFKNI